MEQNVLILSIGTVPPIGSLWANSVLNGMYEDYFLQEVIPYVETNYKVDSRRETRLIMGIESFHVDNLFISLFQVTASVLVQLFELQFRISTYSGVWLVTADLF